MSAAIVEQRAITRPDEAAGTQLAIAREGSAHAVAAARERAAGFGFLAALAIIPSIQDCTDVDGQATERGPIAIGDGNVPLAIRS